MTTFLASTSADRLSLAEWQGLAETHPASTAFHQRAWIELLMEQYGFPLHIPAVKEGGEVVAALPFLETRKPWGAKKLISLPFTDCVRALTRDEPARALLLEAGRAEPPGDCRAVIVRTDQPLGEVAGPSVRVLHQLDTTRPLSEITRQYTPNVRRNLRRAEESGLRFQRSTGADAMETFYRLHLATRKKHGVPIQPKSYFARLRRRVLAEGLGFIGLVTKDGTAIAAAVFLTHNKTMIYKYGASDLRALDCRPNEFLMHNAIRLAVEEGCAIFDFGMSPRHDEGLCRFKRKWGATEFDLHHEYLRGTPPDSARESRAERVLAQVIVRSPPMLCRMLGELLYKYSQ